MLVFVLLFSVVLSVSGQTPVTCPADWMAYKNSCYVFISDKSSWTGAQTICRLLRARLVEIETADENTFVTAMLRQHHSDRSWIGLNDFTREGTFVWTSSMEVATYTNWFHGEPNNQHGTQLGDQDCATIVDNGFWDDEFCETAHHQRFICENTPNQETSIIG